MTEKFFTPTPSFECCLRTKAISDTPVSTAKTSLIAVIYAGSKSVIFTIYTTPNLKYLLSSEQNLQLYTPQNGWFEQDANEIIEALYKCSADACGKLIKYGFIVADIQAVAITNERDTTVIWDARSGRPLHKAILGKDRRTATLCEATLARLRCHDQNHYKPRCGLPISGRFVALKLRWLHDNVLKVREAINGGYCRAGTLDSWIIWNLTKGALHITDVTNASRTLLMNIHTFQWDELLLQTFSIDKGILPQICTCAEKFGEITAPDCALKGLQISGVIADQPASLMGQMCLETGQTICNHNDDCSVLCNIGEECVISKELYTTVAYACALNGSKVYALEGVVPVCGCIFNWLRHVHILPHYNLTERYANAIFSTDDLFFVPAFANSCGTLIGLTSNTTRRHVVRAAYEAICFQVCDVFEALREFAEFFPHVVYAGGSFATSELLLQLQADTAGLIIVRYSSIDAISYGAAMCAGGARDLIDLKHFKQGTWRSSIDYEVYLPLIDKQERMTRYVKWRRAVKRSMDWSNTKKHNRLWLTKNIDLLLYASISASVVLLVLLAVKYNYSGGVGKK